jgi:hypothetical protein
MDRRGFLRGVFASAAGTGLLIRASPEDVTALALKPDEPLIVQPDLIVSPASPVWGLDYYLYDRHGHKVAMVTSLEVQHNLHRLTTLRIEAIAEGPIDFSGLRKRG